MSSFIKDVLNVGLSKIFIIVFGLLTSSIIARQLGPEKSGIIASLLVFPSLFMTIGSLGIRQSATYFVGKKAFSEVDIKKAIVQIWFFTTIISLICCFYLLHYLNSENNLTLIILAIMPIPFSLFNVYNSGIFLGKNQIKKFNKVQWIPKVVTFVLTVLLVVILPFDMKGYMLALLGGPFIIFILLIRENNFLNSFDLRLRWDIIGKLLKLGIVYAVALLVISLNYRLDIILLDYLSTSYEVGIYAKGSGIAQYLWQIPTLLSTIIFARSSTAKDDKLFSYKVIQILRISLIVTALCGIVLFFISDWLIISLFSESFKGSIHVLNMLLIGVILLTIYKVMNMDLAGKGKPWVSLKAMVPSLLLNVILNIMWIPEFGAKGAALASSISYSFAAILFLFFYSFEVGIPIRDILTFKRKDFDFINNLLKK